MSPRKYLIAEFSSIAKYKIPKHIDLENQDQVDEWYVKWGELHIRMTNGKKLIIKDDYGLQDCDYKYPISEEIEERDDEDDDDETASILEGQDCRKCGSFIKDGDEFVPPESAHAYCKTCVEKYDDIQAECFPVDECRCDTCGDCIGDSKNKCNHDRFCYCEEKEEPAQEDNLKSIVVGKVKKTRKLRK